MMKNFLKRLPAYIVALLIGVFFGIKINEGLVYSGNKEDIEKFSKALNITEQLYIDSVDSKKLVEDAIKGMFSELDPHTTYIPPMEQSNSEDEFRGNFEGIGIEFQIINDTITVISPITGGPSEQAGILSGDKIVKIDGVSSVGLSNDKVIKKLKGKKGTSVLLTIFRSSTKSITDFKIIRDTINLYSVEVSLMFDSEIGYANISRFAATTTDELLKALELLAQKGMKKFVLDLRNNPGGYWEQAGKVSDLFIDSNKIIVYSKGRFEELNEKINAEENYPYEKIPIIVLVNRGTASASEIVAGAIQDWDRGLIVGETTFGKGLVQRPVLLPDNSAVRITMAKYYTPSGRSIQREYKNKFQYIEELMERNETEFDNINHTAEKDTARPTFKTKHGRTVFGGGGITPDYIIESGRATEYSNELRKNNVYYQYVRNYMDKFSVSLKNRYRSDVSKFIKEFSITEKDLIEFVKFADKLEVKFIAADFQKDKLLIQERLKAFIARDLFKDEGWYSVVLRSDNQFLKAIQLFDEVEKLPGFRK